MSQLMMTFETLLARMVFIGVYCGNESIGNLEFAVGLIWSTRRRETFDLLGIYQINLKAERNGLGRIGTLGTINWFQEGPRPFAGSVIK